MKENIRHQEHDPIGRVASPDGLRTYFTTHPEHDGFIKTAVDLGETFDWVTKSGKFDKPIELPVRPPSDGDPYHYKLGTEREGTHIVEGALRDMIGGNLDPKSYRDKDGEGAETWHGTYQGVPISLSVTQEHGVVQWAIAPGSPAQEASRAA